MTKGPLNPNFKPTDVPAFVALIASHVPQNEKQGIIVLKALRHMVGVNNDQVLLYMGGEGGAGKRQNVCAINSLERGDELMLMTPITSLVVRTILAWDITPNR